ncbi:MAG: DUF92 domain-containing protein [Cytophagaceae bacterium]|jgi:uncharacterized protein (TIGR00297 family)|nr:DUF92 domain-containing protein [Cytophagaceae bacterium]
MQVYALQIDKDLGWHLLTLCASLIISLYSYRKKSVSLSGFIAMLWVSSFFIFNQQLGWLLLLFSMFASSSLLTSYKKALKEGSIQVELKSGPRDAWQAICNLGISVVCMGIFLWNSEPSWLAALLGSVASANSDSWASEIGMLSTSPPRMITTWKPVPRGTSGGVSALGLAACVGGSAFISIPMYWLACEINPLYPFSWSISISSFLAGIVACQLDSLMGERFQALFRLHTKEQYSEINSSGGTLLKGFAWFTNDLVNFITTLAGAALALLFYILFS